MRLDDFLLSLTVLLLRCPEAGYPAAREAVREDCGAYDLLQPRTPGRTSVGARLADGRELGLLPWLDEARRGAPAPVRVLTSITGSRPELPAHQAAAFAGSTVTYLGLGPSAAPAPLSVFALNLLSSPEHAITAQQLLAWIDRQPHAAAYREALIRELDDFNAMNDRPPVAEEALAAFLGSPAGDAALSYDGDGILRALQLRSRELGVPLEIDGDEATRLVRHDPDDFVRQRLERDDPEGARAFVPSEEQLSLLEPVPAEELIAWISGLPCADLAWERVRRTMARSNPDSAPADASAAVARLREMDPDDLQMTGSMYLTAVQAACRLAEVPLTVPPSLAGRVGTFLDFLDPEERRQYIPERERLHFAPNPAPWQFYCFAHQGTVASPGPGGDASAARDRLLSALAAARAVAERLGSPFAEAFALAALILDTPALTLEPGSPGDRALLQAAGLSEQAQEIHDQKVDDLAIFGRLGAPPALHRALVACDVADVFGGMGSWNDLYVENEADAEAYQAASAELFAALRAFFVGSLDRGP